MIAAAANQPGLVTILIKAGADIGARDEKGETALSIAREKDGQAVIKLLEQPAGTAGSQFRTLGRVGLVTNKNCMT